LIVLALILAGAIATADAAPSTAQTPPPPAAKAPASDSSKLVCTREQIAGTRMTKKVCRTQAEVDAAERAKDQFFHYSGDHSAVAPGSMPPGSGLSGG
jgi:hypothetical protein